MLNFLKDKFNKLLKLLSTDANTFVGFILTLVCIYFTVDRAFEVLLMLFVGVGASYWTFLHYTVALLLVFVTFLIMFESNYVKYKNNKMKVFYFYGTMFATLAVFMFTELINKFLWSIFFSAPNYTRLFKENMDLIRPAFSSLAFLIPYLTVAHIYAWFTEYIEKQQLFQLGIMDLDGLSLTKKAKAPEKYTNYSEFGVTKSKGKKYGISEQARFKHLLIIGKYGSGKTANIIEPMIARDIEKKRFFTETSKELGYALLKSGVAVFKSPYTNSFLNKNFSLNLLKAREGKESAFYDYLKNLRIDDNNYKDLGVTAILSDSRSIDKLKMVANNYGYEPRIIDPKNRDTYGINPFSIANANQAVDAISHLILTLSKFAIANSTNNDQRTVYSIEASLLIEYTIHLLIETYPRKNEGLIPNIEDLIKLLNNFDFIDILLDELREKENSNPKYKDIINFFDTNLFENDEKRQTAVELLKSPISLLESIIKTPELQKVLCQRTNNIDFNLSLKNGDIVLACIRQGELPKAMFNVSDILALFIKNLYDSAVYHRLDNNSVLSNFFYFDDFSRQLTASNLSSIKAYAKSNVAAVLAIDSLQQLRETNLTEQAFQDLENTIFVGKASMDDMKFIEKLFGVQPAWVGTSKSKEFIDLNQAFDEDDEKGELGWISNVKAGALMGMKPNNCGYRFVNNPPEADIGIISPIESKHLSGYKLKEYDFINLKATPQNNRISPNKLFNKNPGKSSKNSRSPIKYG